MVWTHFWDMHSGGRQKEPYGHIYIEAPEAEAMVIFFNRFGHNPVRVTCTCCGEDYSVYEGEDLAQLTGFQRGCRPLETPRDPKTGLYKNDDPIIKAKYYYEEGEEPPEGYSFVERAYREPYLTLDKYLAQGDVLAIHAAEIRADERTGELPEQGYVWVD